MLRRGEAGRRRAGDADRIRTDVIVCPLNRGIDIETDVE
jgi:hypothetical protein